MKQHPYRKTAPPAHSPTPPPVRSRIRVSGDSKALTLCWPPLRPKRERGTDTLLILFLFLNPLLALLGADWLVPEYSDDMAFQFNRALCVAGWLIVGMRTCRGLVYAIRPPPGERVVLTVEHLSYDPSENGPELRVPWHLVSLKLARAGKRQRLMLQRGVHGVEVGQDLSDRERAWLADTIEKWAVSHGHR